MVTKTKPRPAPVPAKRIVQILEACSIARQECEECNLEDECLKAWDELCSRSLDERDNHHAKPV